MTAIKHRVLVTGYGPFRQYTENPSWLAVSKLHNSIIYTPTPASHAAHPHAPHPKPEPIHITALEIPVVYDAVLATVPGLHAAPPHLPAGLPDGFPAPPAEGYSLIVHVGVGHSQPLRLELIGDKTGYDKPDYEGKYADALDEVGQVRGFAGERYAALPERLIQSAVDAKRLLAGCANDGVEVITSCDAGHYLCDFILYCSLAESMLEGRETPVLFIHCSPVDDPMSTPEVACGLQSIIANTCAVISTP